jgi:hypothetical protein
MLESEILLSRAQALKACELLRLSIESDGSMNADGMVSLNKAIFELRAAFESVHLVQEYGGDDTD